MIGALIVISGITLRRHHHGECRVRIPAQIEILQLPVARRHQRRHQVRHHAQHQHLTFRIAEAHIVFDQLRAILGDHQSGEQHALVRRAGTLQRAHGRMNDLVHHAPVHLVGHDRRRRIGAHAAGVRPLVAIADALVVLRRSERDRGLAVAEREERGFLADKAILDHDFPAGVPRPPPNIMSMAASASCTVSATTTPLPAASPSAFTTIGAPFLRT